MKNIDDTDASAPTGNPAPGFVPAVKKKLIDSPWIGVALVAFVVALIFILKK